MPDEEKPKEAKPVLFVLPRGVSAEEAAKLLSEFAERHKADSPPAAPNPS
jgi:hypothetical protein